MNERINEIAKVATKLFIQQGYAKTHIGHIAKEVGVSVGTIYLDFTGKREILHFIFKTLIQPRFREQEFKRPITDALFTDIENEVIVSLEEMRERFAAPLKNGLNGYSFERLMSDAFDLMSDYAAGCLIIEKNAFEFKRLAEHYRAYRNSFFETMKKYLNEFARLQQIRALPYPELTATLIIETLSWWAMDIRFSTFETQNIATELAKKVCLDNLVSAYSLS